MTEIKIPIIFQIRNFKATICLGNWSLLVRIIKGLNELSFVLFIFTGCACFFYKKINVDFFLAANQRLSGD